MKKEQLRYGLKVTVKGMEGVFELHCYPPYEKQVPLYDDEGLFYAKVEELELAGPDTTELEAEFQKTFDTIHPLIQSNLEEAARLINEAVQLSEKNGIPFCPKAKLAWIAPSYIPKSFEKLFPEIAKDGDFWTTVTDAHGGYYKGWQYSQTC